MNNPIEIYNNLRDIYLKYISSGMPFFNEEYNDERKALMNEPGTICQSPIIEVVPKYHQYKTLYDFCKDENVSFDLDNFVKCGLFYNDKHEIRKLYKHQYDSLFFAYKQRKNIVVTTGTGSGKTECFLLPVIADLIKESMLWKPKRQRAMRSMILYPLNALAEDQMIRLRKALNSRNEDKSGARDWLDANRNGNRFYFGRYTGSTPISGDFTKKSVKDRLRDERNRYLNEWEAVKKDVQEQNNKELLYFVPCMDKDSSEMWDRMSMQENAPDILITNYSMLNIMLMRQVESHIFEQTRLWLESDKHNVFHLIVDELHTYRGSSGTEVSYLIKVLLDRLGLSPDSPQVQFLATSASMGKNKQTDDYLGEFFGLTTNEFKSSFAILNNPPQLGEIMPSVPLPIKSLINYSNHKILEKDREAQLFEVTKCHDYVSLCNKYKLVEWLKFGLTNNKFLTSFSIDRIAENLQLDVNTGLFVVESIIKILCQSKIADNYILPLRAHFFFRSVNGLWACSNPNCKQTNEQYRFRERELGKIYKRPRSTCDCGCNVLEVIVCESCGETFLGGYVIERRGKLYISIDKPVSEEYTPYCVMWHINEKNKDSKTIIKDGWRKYEYNTLTGEIISNMDGNCYLYIQVTKEDGIFPIKCPQCEVAYNNVENFQSPLKKHVTGLQKVNQILADALIRTMKKENNTNSKLVLFSDSRQTAAKLSAGIELDHYRDVLRWCVLRSLNIEHGIIRLIKKYRTGKLSRDETLKIRKLRHDPIYKEIIIAISDEKEGWLSKDEINSLDIQLKNIELRKRIDYIVSDVSSKLLQVGINPAGPRPSLARFNEMDWFCLYDFHNYQPISEMNNVQNRYYQNILLQSQNELLFCLFAHKKRSFEAMKLGYVSILSNIEGEHTELLNTIIRILGEKKRIKGFDSKYPIFDRFPRQVRKYLKHVYNLNSERDKKITDSLEQIKNELRAKGVIDKDKVALTGNGIAFRGSGSGGKYWICPRCKTVHMQPANGICMNCFSKLEEKVLTDQDIYNNDDYYLSLLNNTENIFRLHCEELTGQTSKDDSRRRQRLFQNVYMDNELPEVDGIDLLSVTTTMEAGVDIGSLSAVMMGNVPPQRFNYQQRVGRAGRRGNPLSIALTVAKNSSHDITHYFETERMVSSSPKDPYLEVKTVEIAQRVIFKEVLNKALGLNDTVSDSIHGSFGSVLDWSKNRQQVDDWIKQNDKQIEHVISVVCRGSQITKEDQHNVRRFILNKFTDEITGIAKNIEYTQNSLSERLANAGLLPMFGFPTRTRNLYLSKPEKLPWYDVVTRDIDIAMSTFAPGHEIVKDKKVYKSVGIVEYEYSKNFPIVRKDSLNIYKLPLWHCPKCDYSTVNRIGDDKKCPICGNDMSKIKVCSPLGFCVDYNAPIEDFNGSYDWYSPSSEIKLDCEDKLSDCPCVGNLLMKNNKIPSQGIVHQVNDNGGKFYNLGQNYNNAWIDEDSINEQKIHLSNTDQYAFVVTKTTGVLTLSVNKHSDDICISPLLERNNTFAIRSAFLSWGYLVRKAVCEYLDIDINELNVGYGIVKRNHTLYPEVFLVEQIENGAGYCNYLSGEKDTNVPFEAIIAPLIIGGNLYNVLTNRNHSIDCLSSCYDCIRDYSNQKYHKILNWRLGLDVAILASDNKTKLDFNISYWKDYIEKNLASVLKEKHRKIRFYNNMYIITLADESEMLLVHPFWSKSYINRLKENLNNHDIGIVSILDIASN